MVLSKAHHKEISRFYSKNYGETGMRFRNVLAQKGANFSQQTAIGKEIVAQATSGLKAHQFVMHLAVFIV